MTSTKRMGTNQIERRRSPKWGYVCLLLLSFQFGMQPIVTRHFLNPNIDQATIVLLGEILKAIMAFTMIVAANGFSEIVRCAN